jgi:hypothetical protein
MSEKKKKSVIDDRDLEKMYDMNQLFDVIIEEKSKKGKDEKSL